MTLRRKARPIWRPQESVPLPRDAAWKKRCRMILERDVLCRRCGVHQSTVVDHIIPRRLCRDRAEADASENLAGLCDAGCHSVKTGRVEPRLYRGDVQDFDHWLVMLRLTGPVPGTDQLARAYGALTREIQKRPPTGGEDHADRSEQPR